MVAVKTLKIGPFCIGESRLFVESSKYSYDCMEELNEKVADIRRAHSPFAQYPMEPSETKEQWKTRVEPMAEADILRKEGEDVKSHLKRMFEIKSDVQKIAPEIVMAIIDVFDLGKFTMTDVKKKTNWHEMKCFIYEVLKFGDIPCADFNPED